MHIYDQRKLKEVSKFRRKGFFFRPPGHEKF